VAGHESRHNLTYWRYRDYAGVGPGAHGRLNGLATVCEKYPETWVNRVEQEGHAMTEQTQLTGADQAPEYLLMSMRISEGLDLRRHAALAGVPISAKRIEALAALDLVREVDGTLQATRRGRPLLNAIIRELNG